MSRRLTVKFLKIAVAIPGKMCYYIRAAEVAEDVRYPGVAQMVARLNGVQEAAGSNPVTRTNF